MRLRIFLAITFCLTNLSLIAPAQARPDQPDFFERGREQFEEEIERFEQQNNEGIAQETEIERLQRKLEQIRQKLDEIEQKSPTSNQLPPLIDRELFFGNPEISAPQLSPDGKYISFLKPIDGVRNIWVKGIDEPFASARPITKDTQRSIPGYFWSQDGQYILYAQDSGGDENFHIYAVSPLKETVSAARDLTPEENIQARIVAVPENTPNQIIIGLNNRDPRFHDIYSLDLTTGEKQLLVKNDQNIARWVTDLEGNVRLAVRSLADGSTEILRVDGAELVSVYTCIFGESCDPIRYHPDGERVYLITNKGQENDLTELVLFNPKTQERELVHQDPQGEVDFGGTVFSPVTEELIATFYIGDRLRIYPQDEKFTQELEFLQANLPPGDIGLNSITEDGKLALVNVSSDINPGSIYLFNRQTLSLEKVYDFLPQINREHLATMEPVRYIARDGLEISAYLTLPKGVEPRNLPTVIFPHGGPWARDVWGYNPFTQFLANRGYAVLQPNFRGSTGYGKAFINAGNKEWGIGAMQHDITDGAKYLVEQGIADPDKIGIFGASYGGYATLSGLAFTPDIYAAGVSYVGPSNIFTLLESIPPYWESFLNQMKKRVGDPEDPQQVERLKQQSPLFSASKIKAPLMVIQGANDPRVKQAESDQIVVALRDLGQDVEYLLAADEGHGFSGETNSLAVAAAMEKFLGKYLGGRFQESLKPEIKEKLEDLTVDVDTVEVSGD